tara:strand:+ start:365 stop:682 length:318 start_codon:yes stop_codon:yes gene_type:complete
MAKIDLIAKGFKAIGSTPRLAVFLELVKAGKTGLSVGEIQEQLDIPLSTLAHHLRFLENAELIHQEKKGRSIFTYANFHQAELLASYVLKECCRNEKQTPKRKTT